MQVRSLLLLGAAALLPASVALADGGCPVPGAPPPQNPGMPQAPAAPQAPTTGRAPDAMQGPHGGRFVAIAEHRFEVVDDPRAGALVIYEVPGPTGALVLREAPSIVLADGSTLSLEAVPGATGAWRVRDVDAMRRASLADARLRVSIDGREQTAALATTEPSAAVPTGFVEPLGAHGGRLLLLGSGLGRVELLHDPRAGKVTVFALDASTDAAHRDQLDDLSIALEGDKRLELRKEADGTFTVTDEALKTPDATITLKGEIDGKPFEKRLEARPASTDKNAPLPGDRDMNAPDANRPSAPGVNPPAPPKDQPRGWGEPSKPGEDASRGSAANLPTTSLVFGDNVARLEARRDPTLGRLTLIAPAGSRATIEDAPVLVVDTKNGPRELTFERAEGNTWVLTSDEIKNESFAGTVKIRVEGRAYESKLGITTRGTTERGTTRDGTTTDGTTTDGTTKDGTTKDGTTRDGASGYGR